MNRTSSTFNLIQVALVTLFLVACSGKRAVFTDFDPAHSYASYKTFAWANDPPLVVSGIFPVESSIQNRATAAIKAEIEAKGYRFVANSDSADFTIAYTLGARDDIQRYQVASKVYDNRENWLWGKQYHSYFFDMTVGEDLREQYTKGVLAIDIFDVELMQPVWHGRASKSLNKAELKGDAENLEDSIRTLLSKFPPQ